MSASHDDQSEVQSNQVKLLGAFLKSPLSRGESNIDNWAS